MLLALLGLTAISGSVAAVDHHWFTLFGTAADVHYHLAIGGLNQWLVLLTFALGPAALLGSVKHCGDRLREFAAAVFILQALMAGAFLAADLALFYIFFEAMLVPMLVIIGLFGQEYDRAKAGLQFFIYTMLGSVMFLVTIWYLAANTGTLSLAALPAAIAGLESDVRCWCFAGVALAFMVKTPLVPFHSWQAPVYAAAPTGGAVLLAGVMAKLGTYGFIAILLPLFPEKSREYAPWFVALGLIGVIYGAVIALTERNLKRILAFSSLSHLGLVVIGIFSFHATALNGALVQMVAHGLGIGALFLLLGMAAHRIGSDDISDMGGLATQAPAFAVFLVVAMLTAVAMPGTIAFVGELQLLSGTFKGLVAVWGGFDGTLITILAGLSLILGAAYMLRLVARVLYGPERREYVAFKDLSALEGLAVAPLLIASLVLGIYTAPVSSSASAAAAANLAASMNPHVQLPEDNVNQEKMVDVHADADGER